MSRRRMRTQAEWKVEAQMPSAWSPRRAARRSLSSPAAWLVKVMAMISQVLGEGLQEVQVLFLRVVGDEAGVAALAVGEEVVDALDEDGGLPAPGPGQEEEGTLGGHSGLALHGVEPLEVPGDHRLAGGDIALLKVCHICLLSSEKPPERSCLRKPSGGRAGTRLRCLFLSILRQNRRWVNYKKRQFEFACLQPGDCV